MHCSACVSFDHLVGGGEQRLRDVVRPRALAVLFLGQRHQWPTRPEPSAPSYRVRPSSAGT
jgi:hypothetical protein